MIVRQYGIALVSLVACFAARAELFVEPGDAGVREDVLLLTYASSAAVPVGSWPLTVNDLESMVSAIDGSEFDDASLAAGLRLRERLRRYAGDGQWRSRVRIGSSVNRRNIRTFDAAPRDDVEVGARLYWSNSRVSVQLGLAAVANPLDENHLRPDGSHIAISMGNWIVSGGWQDRWWGPGRDASLILSNNARPLPGIALTRDLSVPFASRWLGWLGPWSMTTFIARLDDERAVDDALMFGWRAGFRPLDGLEIGVSRTAQWCGDNRPCDLGTFTDLLLGKDNRTVNVSPADEPGNQLAGIDARWTLPNDVPVAVYGQWIGEDSRRGGPEIGSWLRLAGAEHWGRAGSWSYRMHVELADTACREGGLGFSDTKPDCAYNHPIYRTGYRYRGRSIGHSADGDSEVYSAGALFVDVTGNTWDLSLQRIRVNRFGNDSDHSITASRQVVADIQLSHSRNTPAGRWSLGLGARRTSGSGRLERGSEVSAYLQWSSNSAWPAMSARDR